jgi:hypothetical protein
MRSAIASRWHVLAIALLAAAALIALVGYADRELALQLADLALCR